MTTVAKIRLSVLIVLIGLVSACNSQPTVPPATAEPPIISAPMISDPTPQEPGKEVGISVDVSSAGGVTLNYTWNADGGEIMRGQGSPAITYRVPEEPGTYNVRVRVEWDGQSVEKATTIQVEGAPALNSTPRPTETSVPPTDVSTATPASSPNPSPTATEKPASDQNPARVNATAPVLIFPEQGRTYQNPFTFQWQGSLGSGQTYLVRVWHTKSGYSLQSQPLSTTSWTTDLPGGKFGDWRWSVSVIKGDSVVTTSDERMFWFDPFPDSPIPTPS